MFSKRNIAIFVGTLLALMSLCASNAAAEEELGIYVSPENFVVGTYSRYVSVVIDDLNTDDGYIISQIDPDDVYLEIYVNGEIAKEGINYARTEITDEDGDYEDERVLMYSKSVLFDGIELDSDDIVIFTAKFTLNEKDFVLSDDLKLMVPGSGGSKKPGDQEPGNGGPGNGGSGNKRK